jgi:NAD(P)-dependent dehydrogenase (short-subunit alcohol dehydrogenase family)
MADRFQGKLVIVTGAASGIGEATARRFAAEGAKVALVDRNRSALEEVAKQFPIDRTLSHVADVSDSSALDEMVAAVVGHFGRLDVMVNNVGRPRRWLPGGYHRRSVVQGYGHRCRWRFLWLPRRAASPQKD